MAQELAAEATKFKGKAGSMDGWSGDELCDLPLEVFNTAASLFQTFEREGLVPAAWTAARQVHLPKAVAVDSVHEAEKLRPITVLSAWYRLLGSARLKSPDGQRWLESWWPAEACGGKRGSGIKDALADLEEAALTQEGFMVSLDFSLAFDRLDPALAHELLVQVGLPLGLCRLLAVWQHQTRFLQYDGECHLHGVSVSTSLPQGDAWSLVCMVLCLVGPAKDILSHFPQCTLRSFIDDRTFVANDAHEALRIEQAWAAWSQKIGMLENATKTTYFHASALGRSSCCRLVPGVTASCRIIVFWGFTSVEGSSG